MSPQSLPYEVVKTACHRTPQPVSICNGYGQSGKSLRSQGLKSDSHLLKNLFYLRQYKPFKNDEKCFLFHLKSSFCSQDI